MRIYAFYKRDDDSLDMTNPTIVDSDNIPEYLFPAEEGKVYNTEGYEIDLPDPSPQDPTEKERLDNLENTILTLLMMGG